MNLLNSDLLNYIISFNNKFEDLINIKYINKFYYNLYNNYIDSIIFINDIDLNGNDIYIEEVKSSYTNNIIIINDIRQLNYINTYNIKYLNLILYDRYYAYGDEFLFFSEVIIKHFINLKTLNISGMELSYMPKNLIHLEYLDISNNNITRIPKELTKLKILISCGDYTNGLNYIPESILNNLEYLECSNYLKHDIILNKQKIKYVSISLYSIFQRNKIYLKDVINNQIILEDVTPENIEIDEYVYQIDELM